MRLLLSKSSSRLLVYIRSTFIPDPPRHTSIHTHYLYRTVSSFQNGTVSVCGLSCVRGGSRLKVDLIQTRSLELFRHPNTIQHKTIYVYVYVYIYINLETPFLHVNLNNQHSSLPQLPQILSPKSLFLFLYLLLKFAGCWTGLPSAAEKPSHYRSTQHTRLFSLSPLLHLYLF